MMRHYNRTSAYAKKMKYICANPICKNGFSIEAHHIIPLKEGGEDKEENMITLCFDCHHEGKLHSNYKEAMITLFTWKFYLEYSLNQLSLKVPLENENQYKKDREEWNRLGLEEIEAYEKRKNRYRKQQETRALKRSLSYGHYTKELTTA